MTRIVLVTAIASLHLDDDMPPLQDACARAGLVADVRAWDDATVSWGRYDLALLRSPWDYMEHHARFIAWCERVGRATTLLNPPALVRWNTDKHYLADLAADGIAVVPTTFVEPDADPVPALEAMLAAHPEATDIVVKPAISAGSKDTARYRRDEAFAAANHIGRLLEADRSVMLQPYLGAVDVHGETALLYFDGVYSHAIRKAPLLRPGEPAGDHTAWPDAIAPRDPADDERALADRILAAVTARNGGVPPVYARIDLVRDAAGAPCLLEAELTEPSLFFGHAPGAADRLVAALRGRLQGPDPRP